MAAYFINEVNFSGRHAGYKARRDAAEILMKSNEIKVVNIPLWGGGGIRAINSLKLMRFFLRLNENDIIIFNFPLPKPFWRIFHFFSWLKKIKLVALIHDIDLLRGDNSCDIEMLRECAFVISHNERMTSYLYESGLSESKIVDLIIFDYLIDSCKSNIDFNEIREIIYAGNLDKEKSGFIYTLIPTIDFKLYGINYDNSNNLLSYNGSFDANHPDVLKGDNISFGLVWDGDSVDTCTGNFGKYLRYNNPHKTSLYLSLGIPVFIWKEAAMADFITSCNVGFAISSISEAEKILSEISISDYFIMKKNAVEISKKIRSGYFLTTAIRKVISCQ